MSNEWMSLICISLMALYFAYKQAWVKTRQLKTQRQLMILQTQLRDRLVAVERSADKKTITTMWMINDGLNRAMDCVSTLSLSRYLRYLVRPQSQDDRDRDANFRRRLREASIPELNEIVEQADELLYQQLKCNALLAILTLAPLALVFWFGVVFIETTKRAHSRALNSMKVDMFWQTHQTGVLRSA
ncbi:hypothetical protein PUN50_26950 (plasmid) [Vibrio campbellii]|uniref:Uncharacterized protein n=2 Tax=Vibrio harveyi group TaxID=717610 RepID=A0AAQ2Y4I3_9VIBR|nr:hypothetical protein [Vibrio campbellii]WDG12060.1 hypothetical protein PUN50_26950 [Vibrio campbellii]